MIEFNDPASACWIEDRAGVVYNPATDTVISSLQDGDVQGCVLYQRFTDNSCEMHVAGEGKRWVTPEFLWTAFHYPFVLRNLRVVYGPIPSFFPEALRFALKLGFKEVTRLPDVFSTGDLIVLAMYKHECKFLDIPFRTAGRRTHGRRPEST